MKIYKIAGSTYRSATVDKFLSSPGSVTPPVDDYNIIGAFQILKDMGERGIRDAAEFDIFSSSAETGFPSTLAGSYTTYHMGLAYIDMFFRDRSGYPEIDQVLKGLIVYGGPVVNDFMARAGIPSGVAYNSAIQGHLKSILIHFGSDTGFSTTRKEQYPMFQKLYQEFNNNISSAASSTGNTALVMAIAGEALLQPVKLAKAVRLTKAQPLMFTIANRLVDNVMQKHLLGKYDSENFQVVKETLMGHFGVITAEQTKQVEKERKEKEMLGGSSESVAPVTIPGTPGSGDPVPPHPSVSTPYDVSDNQWLNPGFLTSLAVFFNLYRNRLAKLPS